MPEPNAPPPAPITNCLAPSVPADSATTLRSVGPLPRAASNALPATTEATPPAALLAPLNTADCQIPPA